jgi:hypothetical protein
MEMNVHKIPLWIVKRNIATIHYANEDYGCCGVVFQKKSNLNSETPEDIRWKDPELEQEFHLR